MKNLKIWQKLAALALLGATPVAVLIHMFIESRNEQIAKARSELSGLEAIKPVRDLVQYLPEHRTLANNYLSGDMNARAQMGQIEPKIERAMAAIDEVERREGRALGISQHWDVVKANWKDLKERLNSMGARESFNRHTQVIQAALQVLRTIGDRKGLSTDPQVETLYLGNNLLEHLTSTAEAMDQMRALGTGLVLRGKPATTEETAQLIYLTRLASTANARMESNAKAAARGRARLEERLTPLTSSAAAAAGYFTNLTRNEFITKESPTVAAQDYYNAGTTAIEQYFKVWDESAAIFQDTLVARVAALNQQKWLQLSLALAVLLVAAAITLTVQRGITTQVRSIMELFRQIRDGNLRARAEVIQGDELGDIASGLNGMLDNTLSLMQTREEKEQIQRSISRLLDEVSGVAEGDLRKEAEVTADITGAIADSFNYMIGELRDIIASVQRTTVEVNASASQVQNTAEILARGSEEQSTQILEASSAIEQMATSVQHVSATAQNAAVVARQALGSAQEGAESVRKTIEGMNSIRGQVQETAKRIKRLGESSQEIGEIVELIGDIADRTSILALNASIQAAMAGEAGKGFAVVADEVERLAERATEATKRIGTLIKSVQGDMNEAMAAMEETTREVVGGSTLANEAGQRLSQIEAVSQQIAEMVQQISLAASQQAMGSEAVSRNVTGISAVTRQTAEGARQTAAAIHHLAALAEQLNSSVSRFKLPQSNGRTAVPV
ncbi:MAG: methyl-accepting chemotaxis protein [Bryobacteraceae bacterium]|nr:methyl-accepting chemotaxis protein [Bryobacteraceae bacterium]